MKFTVNPLKHSPGSFSAKPLHPLQEVIYRNVCSTKHETLTILNVLDGHKCLHNVNFGPAGKINFLLHEATEQASHCNWTGDWRILLGWL